MKKIVFIIALMALALVLAGCQGGTTENKGKAATDVQSAGANQAEPASGAGSGAADSQSQSSLKNILSGKLVKYYVEYTTTAAGETVESAMAFDLPKTAIISKTEQGESRTIFDGETVYLCNNMQGAWQCYKMGVQNTAANEEIEKGVSDSKYIPEYLGSCSVAGESGSKYKVTTGAATTTICYTRDGILLEMSSTGENADMHMVATKVSRNVDKNLFVPPAEPTELPGMPG